MSGKRQHYIPQFLQRGFFSHSRKDQYFTWVFRKDREPFNTNIVNSGLESQFYSNKDDTEVDDKITDAEYDLGLFISNLRDLPDQSTVDSNKAAQLISHIEVRTRHIRQNFLNSGSYLMDELLRFFSDKELSKDYLLRSFKERPELLEQALSGELKKLGIPQSFLPIVMSASQPHLITVMDNVVLQLSNEIHKFRDVLPAMLKDACKKGHIDGLRKSIAPEVKIAKFSKLNYQIVRTNSDNIPLGDSGVIFKVDHERLFKPFCEGKDNILGVILPISSSSCLVGREDNIALDLEHIPQAIASCSLEFFIAKEKTDQFKKIAKMIGTNAHIVTKEELKNLVLEVLNN